MAKRDVYHFRGMRSPTDVVVFLTESQPAERGPTLDPDSSQAAAAGHAGTNDESGHEGRNLIKTTEFRLWSTVLKEQSTYFQAEILRWSATTASEQLPATRDPWRYVSANTCAEACKFARDSLASD